MNRFGLFRGLGVDYAIPLQRLVRILPRQQCYLLPKLPEAIAGVVIGDGQLIPQIDLAQLLPCAGDENGLSAYQVLVESECGTLALLAEQSCGIVADSKGEVVAVEEPMARWIVAVFHFQGKIFQVLDIDSLAIGLIQESW